MADLVRHAVGVDLVEVALRQALGEYVPDDLALPRFAQPLAIRFFTAEPGPLPTGRVTRIGELDAVLASEGVVQADTYLQVGETIRPVRRDGDRRGYVIAIADTSEEALARAETAATRLRRGGRDVELLLRPDALRRDPRGGEDGRLPLHDLRRESRAAVTCSSGTTSTSRSTPRFGWPSSRRSTTSRRRTSS